MRRMNLFFWWKNFRPTGTPTCSPSGVSVNDEHRMFECFGEDLKTVSEQAQRDITKVWTLLDVGGRAATSMVIVPGMHRVNRLGYYITEKSWVDQSRDVLA